MSEIKVQYPIGGFAPGMYGNTCRTCGVEFIGDKYARQCEPCAINTVNESNSKALKELHQLKTALRNIELGYETINKALQKANGVDSENCKCAIPDVSNRRELYFAFMKEYNSLMGESEHQILKEEVEVLLAKYSC